MNHVLRNNELYHGEGRQMVVDLWNRDHKVFSMIYDVPLHSGRFESNGIRRVFMIYHEGKRQPKTILKNEYGFDVGVIDSNMNDTDYGCIELFGELFYYNLRYQSDKIMHIYKTPGTKPILSTQFEVSSGAIIENKAGVQLPPDFLDLALFGLCWYIQIPENAESIVAPVFFHTYRSRRRL